MSNNISVHVVNPSSLGYDVIPSHVGQSNTKSLLQAHFLCSVSTHAILTSIPSSLLWVQCYQH